MLQLFLLQEENGTGSATHSLERSEKCTLKKWSMCKNPHDMVLE